MTPEEIEATLRLHKRIATWITSAEQFLTEETAVVHFSNTNWMLGDSWHWAFQVSVPPEIWRPQLEAELAAKKAQLADLERTARAYVDAALGGTGS